MQKNANLVRRAEQLYQNKKYAQCIVECEKGLKLSPRDIALHDLCALSCISTQQDEKAVECYQRVVEIDPHHFLANLNIAKIHIKHQRHAVALPFLEKCKDTKDKDEPVHLLLGLCQESVAQYQEAIESYSQYLEANPLDATAYVRMAHTLHQLKQTNGAIELLDMAIRLMPEEHQLLYCKAVLQTEKGIYVSALASYEKISLLKTQRIEYIFSHAEVLCKMRKYEEAESKYKQALDLNELHIPTLINYGNLLEQLKKNDEANILYHKVVEIDPKNVNALSNITNSLLASRDLDNALVYAEKAFNANLSATGVLLYIMCFHCEWARYSELLEILENDEKHTLSGPFAPIIVSNNPESQLKYSKNWTKKFKPTGILGEIIPYKKNEKIKIAYFSSDFFNHATAMLIEGMLKAHDKEKFEIHAFSLNVSRQDEYTLRLRKIFDHYHEVYQYSDRAVAHLSRELQIDIAIDLKGHTEWSRPMIFAEGAAPLQINFLGYPGSMGADFIDYIVADRNLITESNRAFFSENVIYMPDCYQPNNNERPKPDLTIGRPTELPKDKFVFCSFNNAYKITPTHFKVWMRILRQAPDSVFWMLKGTERTQTNLRRYAEQEGIDPERIIFADFLPEAQHLSRLAHADLFLDTFPCNAHTTASDALWAGVPLLTLHGETFASRVASSILRAVGLHDLVVFSEDTYEALALKIYNDSNLLKELKVRVKKGISTGPLYDTEGFTRKFENALENLYNRKLLKKPNNDIFAD